MKSFLTKLIAVLLIGTTNIALANCVPLDIRRSLSNTPWGWNYTNDPVLAGQRSQRFEVRPGDCFNDGSWDDCAMDRERSEISVRNPKFVPGTGATISWNIFIPRDFQDSTKVRTTTAQIHSYGGPSGFAGGLPAKPPLFQFDIVGGQYRMCWHRLSGTDGNIKDDCAWFNLMSLNQMKGRWTNMMLDFDTNLQRGYARVWINNRQAVVIQEPIVNYQPQYFYFKYGLYRSFVSRNGAPMPTQVAYFDEVKIGRSPTEIVQQCKFTVD